MAAYRYWRIYVTANNGNATTAISELELRTSFGGSDTTTPSTPAYQSTYYGVNSSTAAKAVNNIQGSGSNSWVSDGSALPQWIYYDLGTAQDIQEVQMYCEPGGTGTARAPKDFLIQGSSDALSWITQRTITNATGWVDNTPKLFTAFELTLSYESGSCSIVSSSTFTPQTSYRTISFSGSSVLNGHGGEVLSGAGSVSGSSSLNADGKAFIQGSALFSGGSVFLPEMLAFSSGKFAASGALAATFAASFERIRTAKIKGLSTCDFVSGATKSASFSCAAIGKQKFAHASFSPLSFSMQGSGLFAGHGAAILDGGYGIIAVGDANFFGGHVGAGRCSVGGSSLLSGYSDFTFTKPTPIDYTAMSMSVTSRTQQIHVLTEQ